MHIFFLIFDYKFFTLYLGFYGCQWKLRGGIFCYNSSRKLLSFTERGKDRTSVFMRVGRVYIGCGRRSLALLNFLSGLPAVALVLLTFLLLSVGSSISSYPSLIYPSTPSKGFKVVAYRKNLIERKDSFFFGKII